MRLIDTGMLNVIEVDDMTYASFLCPLCSEESAWEYKTTVFNTIRDKGMRFVTAADASIESREFLLTGMCRPCQETLYAGCEDED